MPFAEVLAAARAAPVRRATANAIPVLLGYADFFLEFDICFRRTRGQFPVAPRTP